MNSIDKRTSIRKFQDRPVEEEKLNRVLQAGMLAPSACDLRPWEFLVITDRKDSEAIAQMSPYAKPSAKAAVNIILLVNKKRVEKLDAWWQQDMGACAENILLELVEQGLGGVWMGIYPDMERCGKLKQYFSLPEEIIPFAVIAAGYPAGENEPKDKYEPERIHMGRY